MAVLTLVKVAGYFLYDFVCYFKILEILNDSYTIFHA